MFVQSLKSLDDVLSTPHSNFVITKDLTLIDKRKFSWRVLCLFQPFYQFFGKDIYSHVRASRVAQEVLRVCQHNQDLLNWRPILIKKIETQLLQRLKDKTHGKYTTDIDQAISQLHSIVRPSEEPAQEEPIDKAFSNPLSTNEDSTLKLGSKIYWPANERLRTLEISETALSTIQSSLKNYFRDLVRNPTHDLRFAKENGQRKLQLIDLNVWEEKDVKILSEAEIPFSLEIVRSSKKQITDVIILAKKVLAEGGQTKVKLCHSIFRNKTLVRKSCESQTQRSILEHFLRHPTRGIAPIFHLRPRKDKKTQVMEPLLDFNLSEIANSLNDAAKISIAQDLLYGLCAVHRLQKAHRDLKPNNILVQKIEGAWRGFITDFGFADLGFIGGSLGFRSPEQILVQKETHVLRNLNPFQAYPSGLHYYTPYYDRIKSQPQLSQPGDIWSMGLVLFHLFGSQLGVEGAVLPHFIWEKLNLEPEPSPRDRMPFLEIYSRQSLPKDIRVLERLFQSEIDSNLMMMKEIKLRETHHDISNVLKWWDLMGQMIRKNPKDRISSKDAVRAIHSTELAINHNSRNSAVSVRWEDSVD